MTYGSRKRSASANHEHSYAAPLRVGTLVTEALNVLASLLANSEAGYDERFITLLTDLYISI